jgi:hypothetical protein
MGAVGQRLWTWQQVLVDGLAEHDAVPELSCLRLWVLTATLRQR